MAEVGKKRKSRAGHRTHAKKLIGQMKETLTGGEDIQEYTLKSWKTSLENKLVTLKQLDEAIVALLEGEESVTVEHMALEIEESEGLSDEVREVVLMIEEVLATKQAIAAKANPGTSPDKPQQPQHKTVRAKLPKLEVKRFGGGPCEWQEFWDCFESSVHNNEGLSDIDKFSYLRGMLDEPAKSAIAGFSLTTANYQSAVEVLKARFGKKTAIQRAHMNELLGALPVYHERHTVKLRTLCDTIETHYRGLVALGVDESAYSSIVVPTLLEKLPEAVRLTLTRGEAFREWTVKNLLDRLRQEVDLREEHKAQGTGRSRTGAKPEHSGGLRNTTGSALYTRAQREGCAFCQGNHPHEDCRRELDVRKRRTLLRRFSRCFNCLRKGHKARECTDTSIKCKHCNGKHHTAMCEVGSQGYTPSPRGNNSADLVTSQALPKDSSMPVLMIGASKRIALQTAQAEIRGSGGRTKRIRVLFDSGSHRSFITSRAVEANSIPVVRTEWLSVTAFGEKKQGALRDVVRVELSPLGGGKILSLESYVVPEITSITNVHVELVKNYYSHLADLWFSDVNRAEDILHVDLLIGADYLWYFQKNHIIRGEPDEPVAIDTELGWVLSGPLKTESGASVTSVSVNNIVTECLTCPLENEIQKLWDLDSLGIREVNEVQEAFSDDISFNGERYSVRLPWKVGHATLPTNYDNSSSRLRGQVRRLRKEPGLLAEYDSIIREQLQSGIIERVPELDTADRVHYLPHHAVIRKDAVTTKVRIVYDASAKESKRGVSLNDCLHVGPSLNPLLLDILLRFRENRIALVGDIEKAFLNVEVDQRDRDFLRFVWVENINEANCKIDIYRFCRVVFGLNASPFLLNGTIRHHLSKYAAIDPKFVEKLVNGFYVDDLVTGENSVKEAVVLFENSKERMASGGFKLRKWLTNNAELREKINRSEQMAETSRANPNRFDEVETYAKASLVTQVSGSKSQKVLGLPWDCETDTVHFDFKEIALRASEKEAIKRNVLSVTAGVFDPLGILSPVTVSAKILFQELCVSKIDWDEQLPREIKTRWENWIRDLSEASEVRISRCVYQHAQESVTECHLHGFGDASKKAYCAVVYVMYLTAHGSRHTALLCSKTRVAPLKGMTTPRLELMAATILMRLLDTVINALSCQLKVSSVTYWLDSKTVLYWIQNRGDWKQFVKHRVNAILEKTDKSSWRYCPTGDNPADIGSRGTTATMLKAEPLWWNGPEWLVLPESEWPPALDEIESTPDGQLEERKTETNVLVLGARPKTGVDNVIDINRCGKYQKLLRVTAWVFRFVANLKAQRSGSKKVTGVLKARELDKAEEEWVRIAQEELKQQNHFQQLVSELRLEEVGGILRCRGRLGNSDLDFEARTPIILPKQHRLTELIIVHCHDKVLHSGVRATLAELRAKYWVPKGRQVVKKAVSNCVTCRKMIGKPYGAPETAALPEFRVRESPPFSKVGVDFAGPLFVKGQNGAGMEKVYIALFSCCVTRAIHLELVEDLSAATFRRCLRKFAARRGMPALMLSDNAKTFQATERALKRLFDHPDVKNDLANMRIEWRFNLERAPWWGGFYERMVGNVKQCLKKVLGNARLTLDELATVLAEVEATINCRPLTYDYNELDEEVLTPSHLIFGRRFNTIPDEVLEAEDIYSTESYSARFKYLSTKLAHFWERWRREYLANLREFHRMKRARQSKEIVQIGDVVTVLEKGKKRNEWKLAVVEELIKGSDDVTRGARVRIIVKGKPLRIARPVQKLYPIEVRSEDTAGLATGGFIRTSGEARVLRNVPSRNAALDSRWKTRFMLDS